MDAMNDRMHYSRPVATGSTVFRGAVMAGLLTSTLLTALPSVTFADGDGNKSKHSLVQQPYGLKTQSPFAKTFTTMETLQGSMESLVAEMSGLKSQVDQLTVANTKLAEANAALQVALNAAKVDISAMNVKVAALDTKAADIIPGLGKYLKVDTSTVVGGVTKPDILFIGANVHVRSGSGATNDHGALTGLGNLIIGYNENTPTPTLVRTGSHNLVGGSMQSFSSYGGMVFGYQNQIKGPYANVVGGSANLAQGTNSTVYGSTSQMTVNMNSYAPVLTTTRPTGGGE